MPFSNKKSYSECIKWDYHRLRGRGKVEREDVVVFNFPAGDTVLLENQAVTYYDVLREYQAALGKEQGRKRLHQDYTVIARPVDKRENYIKRCVAIPGDTLQIIDTELFINGEAQPICEERQHIYIVKSSAPLSDYAFRNLDITEYSGSAPYYYAATTERGAELLRKYKSVESVERYNNTEPSLDAFPHHANYAWTQDNFGPLWIPQKGITIELSTKNLPLYERIIDQYEGHDLRVEGDKIYIDGVESDCYTFAMDYYFMMGDNRHNSADSRFWGFVPEDHIVGKALFKVFSKGEDGIRWRRMFKSVK
jgi:signal peptidase I